MNPTRISAVIIGAVLMAAPLCAQNPATMAVTSVDEGARPISLGEAVSLGQQNSVAATTARGLFRNAAAARKQARGSFFPTLNLTASSGYTAGQSLNPATGELQRVAGNPWQYGNALGFRVDLFDGGRRFSEINRIRGTADVADISAITAQFDASLQVKQQFYAALAARESEQAARAQLEQAEQQLKASSARVAAGVATKSDSLRSAIQVGNAQLAVLTAQNDLRVANVALTRVTGSQNTVTAAPTDNTDVLAELPSESELITLVDEGPAVRVAQANVTVARAAKRTQKASYLPTVTMGFNYNFSQNSQDFTTGNLFLFRPGKNNRKTVDFQLSYPIFNGFQREAQAVQADVALDNSEAQLRDARLAARQNLITQLRAVQNAQARVQVQNAAIAAAEEDLRVQQQRYALGASTLLDLLTSQTQLNQARQQLIQARLDGRIARAQLSSLVGREL